MAKAPLSEAGKVLSSVNAGELRTALQALLKVFSSAGIDLSDTSDSTPVDTSEALSYSDLTVRVTRALKDARLITRDYAYIRDIFPTVIVYSAEYDRGVFAVPYSLNADSQIVLGTPVEVLARTTYETLDGNVFEGTEAQIDDTYLTNTTALPHEITLTEAATPGKGRVMRAKLIAPGKGSSGIYPAEVLKRDGPKVFTKGLHMYIDHPTAREEAEKPEGSISRLAGVLASDAVYESNAPQGEGLYADIKVYPSFADRLAEVAADTGLSIRARGKASVTEASQGLPVVTAITAAKSVDFVTLAGAGGKVVELFEAYRNMTGDYDMAAENTGTTPNPELAELRETVNALRAQIAQITSSAQAATAQATARNVIAGLLEAVTLPAASKRRVSAAVLASLPLTEAGALDNERLRTAVQAKVLEEAQYLSSLGVGGVRGTGVTIPTELTEADPVKLNAEIDELLKAL